jgi:hypothetical protein
MTNGLPTPLVPAEVDLRDFAFMPLEVSRLLRSRTWLKARRRPEIGFYLVNLWAGAWHEVPAGSLPDDDDVLSDLARCTPARWKGWPEVMFLNGPRRIALMARLAECGGLDGWRAALEAAARAEFLKGRDGAFHRWFTFDWILQPEKFTRLMEGRYAERHRRDETDAATGGLSETLAALGRAGSGR